MFVRIRLFLLAQLCILLSGCVSEHTDNECVSYKDVAVVNVVLDLSMSAYPSPIGRASVGELQDMDVRIIVGVYTPKGYLIEKKVVSAGRTGSVFYPVDMAFSLPKDIYRFVFWSDYVPSGTVADYYYDTEELTSLTTRGDYVGSTESKDAFTAYKDIDLSAGGQIIENIVLHRPFSQYRIIATDLKEFLEIRGMADIGTIHAKIRYAGFVYDVYDAFKGMPVDIGNGKSFTGTAEVLSSDELLLAWDYVWAGDEESTVKVDMTIYDEDGSVINRVETIEIPCVRNKYVTVKGAFLTKEYNSGIGVITDYEGDIHVPLP